MHRYSGWGEDEANPPRLSELLSNWLRRARSSGSEALLQGWIPAVDSPSPPLSEQDLDSLKRTYLYQLKKQFGALYQYGLDEKLRAAQDSGQMLDPLALYQPLNTTLQVPIEDGDEGAESTTLSSSAERKRLQTLLEAVGRTLRSPKTLRRC